MSGIVAGHSVQAGAVHGGVHFHVAPTGVHTPTPRELPPPPAEFTGRDAELARLDEIMGTPRQDGTPALVILSGPGGVGKTALALQWGHRSLERFPDGHLYVDLAGFSGGEPLDPGEALGRFLRALGVPAQQVPATLAEQATLFRSLTAGKAVAVLLDNAYSAAQARCLLPASDRAAVLVTSRSRLIGLTGEGSKRLTINPLNEAAAARLLASVVDDGRVSAEPEQATTLVRLCGGLPIAVRLAAARLSARPHWSVGRMLTELTDERARLKALAVRDDVSLRALFDLSYLQLAEPAARLYRRLGLHPGREFDAKLCPTLLDDHLSDAEAVLDELVDVNLVEEIAEDRFRFHDLLRLHSRHRGDLDDTSHQRETALRRMLEWYLATAMAADEVLTPYRRRLPYAFETCPINVLTFADRSEALAWLECERENLLVAGQASMSHSWFGLSWHLADVMWPLLLYRKHYRDRLKIDERGVQAAQDWGNPVAEADMLKRLGLVLRTVGRHEEAAVHLRASLAKWSDIGDERGIAEAQEALGLLFMSTGATAEAAEQFEEVLARYRRLGDERDTGLTLINIAHAHSELDRPELAIRQLDEARAIFDRLGNVDPYNRARVFVALAQQHCTTGRLTRAQDLAKVGLDEMRRLGSDFGEAEAHAVLAETELRHGHAASARDHLDRALATFTALRSPRAGALRARLGSCVDQAIGQAAGTSEVGQDS